MVWFSKGKNKDKKGKQAAEGAGRKSPRASKPPEGSGKGQRTSGSEQLRAQALANARQARAAIGEENLQKIAAMIRKKQMSPLEQAKAKIHEMDALRVADEILAMIEDKH